MPTTVTTADAPGGARAHRQLYFQAANTHRHKNSASKKPELETSGDEMGFEQNLLRLGEARLSQGLGAMYPGLGG